MNLSAGIRETLAGRQHLGFVLDSFRECLRGFVENPAAHSHRLERDMRGGLGRVIVATPAGHPEFFLGWAAVQDGALLFAYVPLNLRGRGIARQMVADLFPQPTSPLHLVYWTDSAQRASERDFPIIHDWRAFMQRQRSARRFQAHQSVTMEAR